jgi:uncharacterized membrane protein
MATITFDTLRYVDKLKSAGSDDALARAQAEALSIAINEAMDTQLAKRSDIDRLERELLVIKWMAGFLVAGMTSLIMKAFL